MSVLEKVRANGARQQADVTELYREISELRALVDQYKSLAESLLVRKDAPRTMDLPGFLNAVVKAKSFSPSVRDEGLELIEKKYGSRFEPVTVEKAAMAENSGVTGGYIVPPELKLLLLRSLAEKSFLYTRALKVPMATLETMLPTVNMIQTAASGTSPFQGGMAWTWGQTEGASLVETEPTFLQVGLRAQDLTGYAVVSNQFLADMGPETENFLVELFARGAAWQAEYGMFQGLGTNAKQPTGMINSTACVNITRAGGNAIAAADIANMSGSLIPEGWHNAIWACNPSALKQIQQLSTYFVNMGFREGGAIGYLSNVPLYPTEKLPVLGQTGDLMLFDPSMYILGERQEVIVDADPHSLFRNNQTVFRVWLRLDGKPWLPAPVTLADGSTKASSVIALK